MTYWRSRVVRTGKRGWRSSRGIGHGRFGSVTSKFRLSRVVQTCGVLVHSRGRVPASGWLPRSIVLTGASRTACRPQTAVLKQRIEVESGSEYKEMTATLTYRSQTHRTPKAASKCLICPRLPASASHMDPRNFPCWHYRMHRPSEYRYRDRASSSLLHCEEGGVVGR